MVSATNNLIDKLLENRVRFLSFVQRRVRSKELAEDMLQSALTRAIERGNQIRSNDASIAWFYRLLRNAITDHYRNEATTTRILEQWSKESPASQPPVDPFQNGDCQCIGRLLAHRARDDINQLVKEGLLKPERSSIANRTSQYPA